MKVELDWTAPISVSDDEHAHHTSWAWDAAGKAYVFALHREDESVMAVACYTYENWLNVFERLKEAHKSVVGIGNA